MRSLRPEHFRRLSGPVEDQLDALGPLAGLQGTWMGAHGWSVTALPGGRHAKDGEGDFSLRVQPYSEITTFTPLGGLVRNAGGPLEQFVAGLRYDQRIAHRETSEALHFENGLWLDLSDVVTSEGEEGPVPQHDLCRTASVPHGNVAMMLGGATSGGGAPEIPDCTTLPPDVGDAPHGFLDAYQAPVAGLDPVNPAGTLREVLHGQTVVRHTTLFVDSAAAGGVVSTPFLAERARVSRVRSWVWIETIHDPATGQTFDQLQYCQVVDIEFLRKFGGSPGLISWPHVTVNTLKKQ